MALFVLLAHQLGGRRIVGAHRCRAPANRPGPLVGGPTAIGEAESASRDDAITHLTAALIAVIGAVGTLVDGVGQVIDPTEPPGSWGLLAALISIGSAATLAFVLHSDAIGPHLASPARLSSCQRRAGHQSSSVAGSPSQGHPRHSWHLSLGDLPCSRPSTC